MKATRIFETILYAEDLSEAKAFYGDVLNLDLVDESELFLVFRLPASVLIVFNPKVSSEVGRSIPEHGTIGDGHVAFAASEDEIDDWLRHLEKSNIGIEHIHEWEEGGRSLYVRDPAGNSVEFAPPTLWGGNWDF